MFSFGGQPQQQQQASGLFGQPQPSPSPFGVAPALPGIQPAPASSGLFGAPAAAPGSSLFGGAQATQPATGGLFGQPSAAPSPFGQPAPTSGGLFGQQPAQSGGLFGSVAQPTPSPTPSAFGGIGGTSPFGGAPAATGLGGTQGTSLQKYQTTRDQELNMRLISITAMDAYKNKSLEELRWEDYQSNRNQPGGAPAAGGAWGASQPSTGAFGAAPAATGMFGQQPAAQPTSGLFGSTTTTPSTGGLFGAPSQPSGGGLFGSTTPSATQPSTTGGMFGAPSGGLFGAATTQPQPTGGLFGASAPAQTGGLFGAQPSTTPAPTGGLFGSQPTTTPATGGGLFGATQPASGGGLFGSTPAAAPASGGLFGSSTTQPSTTGGGLFGSTTPTQPATGGGLFGASTSTGGGLFGASSTTTGGGLFGSSSTTTTPAPTGGLFGTSTTTPAQPSGGLFGSQPSTTGGGLFGTSTQQPAGTSTGGLFGTSTTTPSTGGGLFGTTTTQPSTGGGLFGTSTTTGGGLFGSSTTPSTTAGGTGGLFGSTGGGLFGTSTTTPASGGLFGTSTTPSSTGGLFGTSTTPATAPAGSGLGFAQGGLFGGPAAPAAAGAAAALPPVPRPTGLVAPKAMDKDSLSSFLWKEKTGETTPLVPKKKLSAPPSPPSPKTFVPQPAAALPLDEKTSLPSESTPLRLRQETEGAPAVVKPKIVYTTPTKTGTAESPKERRSFLPSLVNHNLWTKPSLEAMAGMTEQELARVEHFQIGQYGIGSVTWPGLTDVRFLNIDDLIIFRKGAVTLFPDEDLKPPVGTGLNKTAIIELFVRPKNLELAKKYESRYVDEMRKLTEKNGAEFLSYDLDAWRFRVEHFSTWGIDESMWVKIDSSAPGDENVRAANDLSLFSRIEKDLFTPDIDEEEDVYEESGEGDESMDQQNKQTVFAKEDFVGALAVAPPTREELKALGWDLKVLDLFMNQSFRASYGPCGRLVFPEHPVVCDSHNVEFVGRKTAEKFNQGYLEKLTTLLKSDNMSWSDLLEQMGESDSLVSLISALMPSGDQSPSSESGAATTLAFNDWLSRMNAETIRANPALSFSPAAALSSHHYSPSTSELLVNSGHPRLALAAAAAADETSRRLMQDQMLKIRDEDPNTQQVAQILGGRLDSLEDTEFDWKIELALRYWYCDGDMSGFEPPAKALEWRVMNSIVLGDSDQLTKLLDSPDLSGNELFAMLVSILLIQRKHPHLFPQDQVCKVISACSDYVLSHPSVDWQLSPIVLSFLPSSGHRDQLIQDVVLRHADRDCEVLRELEIVSDRTLAAARELIEGASPQ